MLLPPRVLQYSFSNKSTPLRYSWLSICRQGAGYESWAASTEKPWVLSHFPICFSLIKWSFPWFFRKKPHFSHQKTMIFDRKIFSFLVFFHNNSLFFPVESDVFIRIKPFFMRISWEIINFMIIILLIYSFYLYKMNKSSYHCRGGLFQAAWNLTSLTLLW